MKKFTKIFTFLFLGSTVFAQEVVYSASTQGDFQSWGFTEVLPGSDGFSWRIWDVSGTPGMTAQGDALQSFSFDSLTSQSISPNDYAVSPSINLTNYTGAKLKWSRGAGSDVNFSENYTVYVVFDADTSDNFVAFSNSDIIYTETIATGQEMLERTVDIPQMDGRDNVFIFFRHHDCSGQYFLAIDDVAIIATDASASLKENNLVEINVFPVPAKDFVVFECEEKIAEVKVFDFQGREVASDFNLLSSQLNVNQLDGGIYTAIVKTVSGNVAVQKFIK